MNRRARILLPLLVLLGGVALAAALVKLKPEVERNEPQAAPLLVRAVRIQPADVQLVVRSQGTIVPGVESTLVAQVAGQIEWVSPQFAPGGRFRRGEPLVRIEDTDYRFALARAEADLARAETRLDLELAEAEQARRDWEELGAGEPTALTLREPQTAEARSVLEGAESALEQARLALTRTRVKAPYDGRVRSKSVDVGQFVAAGTPLAELFSIEYAEIELPVTKTDLGFLDLELGGPGVGEPVPVTLTGELGGAPQSWSARVVRAAGEFDPRTRMLSLFARIDDPFGERAAGAAPLPMGLYVDGEIAGKTVSGATILPRAALRSDNQVLVIDPEGRLRFRAVEVVRVDGEEVVIADGLEPGERICISPLETVIDGMSVRVAEEERDTTGAEEELL